MTEQEFPDGFSSEFEKDIILAFPKEQFPVIVEGNFKIGQSINDFMESRTNGVLKMELQDTSDFGPTIAHREEIHEEIVSIDVGTIDFNPKF